ncbi:carbohydrate-binding protein [Corynebacterium phoceense]
MTYEQTLTDIRNFTPEQVRTLAEATVGLMDDTALNAFYGWVAKQPSAREQQRAEEKAAETAQAKVVQELQDAGKLPLPDALTDPEALPADASDVPEWVNPGTDHSMMYREGDIVRHEGRIVRSTHSGLNHWEPGTLGFDGRIWEDITPVESVEDPETGETITQWAPGIAATVGMKLAYNGATYEVIQAHTTQADWLPDALPALYKKL